MATFRCFKLIRVGTSVLLAGASFVTLGISHAVPAGAVSPGACGSVLLAGTAWLGGGGVDVKSNGANEGTGTSCSGTNKVNGVTSGSEWQCVELVNRLYLTKGWINATWAGNGGDSSPTAHDSMYDDAPANLAKQADGSITSVSPGDVVSINEYNNGSFLSDGHVLIVNTAGTVTSGTVQLVSQNSGSPGDATPQRTATLSGGTLTISGGGGYTYSVIGVVHAPLGSNGGIAGISSSAEVQRANGAVDLYAVNVQGQLAHRTLSPSGWSAWEVLGAGFIGTPTAIIRPNGLEDVFAVNNQAGLAHITLTPTGWSAWEVLGYGFNTSPTAVVRQNGLEDVFAVNNQAGLAHITLTPTGWSAWEVLGYGFNTSPTAVVRQNGLEDVFAVNNQAGLAHITLTPTGWSAWEVLGYGFNTSPTAVVRQNGLEDVFAVNNQAGLAHITLTPTGWSAWEVLGYGFNTSPTAVVRQNGLEDVFAVNNQAGLAHITLTPTGWSAWEVVGSGFVQFPIAVARSNGIEDLVGVTSNGTLQDVSLTPSGWSAWEALGTGIEFP